ncbi:MAG: hypothetical protein HYX91_04130 [Chloroflexi bacterium]|nr:hypothetical protein [Chloroflexota bacterium]
MKIGIPRALLYYQYYPMWKHFFEELGAEVVVSPHTTRVILSSGISRVVADTCLPAKAYMGHVMSLVGKCDCVFIPAIRSLKAKVFNCSKFLGLPDMTRAVVPECPPILSIDVDMNKGEKELWREIDRLGRHFTRNHSKVRQAAMSAWQKHLEYCRLMVEEGLTPPQALERMFGLEAEPEGKGASKEKALPTADASGQAHIAVIGHPYILYDHHVSHRLINWLQQHNIRVHTPEMLAAEAIDSGIGRLVGQSYWTYEYEVVGAGGHYLEHDVDGVIGLVAFGCGPDSLMMDMVRRHSALPGAAAFMNLTLEEHTAEAGIVTRLEAFVDMVRRKKRRKETCA